MLLTRTDYGRGSATWRMEDTSWYHPDPLVVPDHYWVYVTPVLVTSSSLAIHGF